LSLKSVYKSHMAIAIWLETRNNSSHQKSHRQVTILLTKHYPRSPDYFPTSSSDPVLGRPANGAHSGSSPTGFPCASSGTVDSTVLRYLWCVNNPIPEPSATSRTRFKILTTHRDPDTNSVHQRQPVAKEPCRDENRRHLFPNTCNRHGHDPRALNHTTDVSSVRTPRRNHPLELAQHHAESNCTGRRQQKHRLRNLPPGREENAPE